MSTFEKLYRKIIKENFETDPYFTGYQFTEENKQALYNWINEYLTEGGWYNCSNTFSVQQLMPYFLVIDNEYSIRNKNNFNIKLQLEVWNPSEGTEWNIIHDFGEFSDINEAINKICNDLDPKNFTPIQN